VREFILELKYSAGYSSPEMGENGSLGRFFFFLLLVVVVLLLLPLVVGFFSLLFATTVVSARVGVVVVVVVVVVLRSPRVRLLISLPLVSGSKSTN